MKALLIVDVQNDFCPGGALPAPEGDRVVPVINELMDLFPLVVASKDWHPPETIHFERWPVHCVRNTPGAELHPDLRADRIDQTFVKGTGNRDDGYSAFEATNIDLAHFLREKGVTDLFVTGLTTEYCVKASALDAQRNGFRTVVVTDAIAGVQQHPADAAYALAELQAGNIELVTSEEVTRRVHNQSG